jgi:hypothetical protein
MDRVDTAILAGGRGNYKLACHKLAILSAVSLGLRRKQRAEASNTKWLAVAWKWKRDSLGVWLLI